MPQLPPGFVQRSTDAAVLVLDPSIESALEPLNLLGAGGLERLTARPAGASGRAPTAILTLPGSSRRVIVRRVRHGGLLAPILGGALVGIERPLAELRVTARLRERGAPVPQPAFVLARRRGGTVWNAAVATFLEEGAIDALALLQQRLSAKRVLRAAEAAGAALRRFHDAGGSHRDLQLKNLLLRELDARTECIVVDLDRARLQSEVAAADRMKQLMRLFRSLRKRGVLAAVGARGIARFFQAYVGEDRELRRALRRRLAWERLKVAIHALHYRQAQSHWQDSGDGFGGRA